MADPKWHIKRPEHDYSYCGKWKPESGTPLLAHAEYAECLTCLRAHIAYHRAEIIEGERRVAYIETEAPQ